MKPGRVYLQTMPAIRQVLIPAARRLTRRITCSAIGFVVTLRLRVVAGLAEALKAACLRAVAGEFLGGPVLATARALAAFRNRGERLLRRGVQAESFLRRKGYPPYRRPSCHLRTAPRRQPDTVCNRAGVPGQEKRRGLLQSMQHTRGDYRRKTARGCQSGRTLKPYSSLTARTWTASGTMTLAPTRNHAIRPRSPVGTPSSITTGTGSTVKPRRSTMR